MMKNYRIVGGFARVGGGEVVGLSADQYRPRAHNVDLLTEDAATGAVTVRAKVVLDFKAGEVIALPGQPPKAFAERFDEVPEPPAAKSPDRSPPPKPRGRKG